MTPKPDAPFIITLDGPAGVGKSTLAQKVAEALGVAYLDTGAMFRVIALRLAATLAPLSDKDAEQNSPARLQLAQRLEQEFTDATFALDGKGAATTLLCDGRPVGDEIRNEEAGLLAARAGRFPEIRDFLKKAQQALGQKFSLVAEGRDMGTVVFPDACCKFFLDATAEIRAERRFLQLRQMGKHADKQLLLTQIKERDEQDRNRSIAPLRPAGDAQIIDTSALGLDGVFARVMELLRQKGLCAHDTAYSMRRKDRAISHTEALALLQNGEYGVLALCGNDGQPYAVPLSYVVMDNAVYFHCAARGRKIDAMAQNGRACFTVVGGTEPVYENDFSTYYESVMVFGTAVEVDEHEEKRRSLMLLAEKYLPAHMDKAEGDIARSFSRTAVYRLSMDVITGKAKRPKKK